jgi:TolB-like protein
MCINIKISKKEQPVSKKLLLTALLLNALVFIACHTACAGELRIAIFPFSVHTQDDISYIRDGITSLLPSRIAVSGRLSVIDSFLVRSELGKLPADHPLTQDISVGKKLHADYILIGSITKIGSNVSLDTRLINSASPDDVTPFFIQSIGLNDMLPQLTSFGARVRQKILGSGPEIEAEAARADGAPGRGRAQAKAARPAGSGDEQAADETLESPLEPEYQTVVQPRGEKGPPLFEPGPFYSFDIAGESLHCITAGDVDGDGTKELLLSGEHRVLMYKWAEGGLKQSGELKAGIGEHLVHLDTADTNKNKLEEIFVTSFEKSAPNSFVLEVKDGSYSRIAKSQPWFFRIYQPPGKRLMIMGQNAGETSPFGNVIYTFSWKNGNLEARNEFLIPESLQLYSFVQADIDGDGRLEYIAFNKGIMSYQYQLTIFSSLGKMRWRDQHLKLGGEVNYFTKRVYGNDMEQKDYLPMRILSDDYNRDGRIDIVVGRNSTKGNALTARLAQYNQGEVCCLNWDGYDLSLNWTSGMMAGYVADYGVFDLDGDGRKEIFILSVTEPGMFSKGKNQLTVFKTAPVH